MKPLARNRRPLTFCALVLSTPALEIPAHALPTSNPLPGITGLGIIPTTDTVPEAVPEVSLSYERVELSGSNGKVDLLPVASVIYGVGKGELGATYVREHQKVAGFSSRDSYFALQGKVRVFERQNTEVAVGAHYYDFGSENGVDLGNVLSGYVTASLNVKLRASDDAESSGNSARLHGGLLVQRQRGQGSSDTLVRPFVGAEYHFTPHVSLAADYLASSKDAARALSLSLRYTPQSSPLSAQLGIGRLRRDTKFFVGLSYSFGGLGGEKSSSAQEDEPAPDEAVQK